MAGDPRPKALPAERAERVRLRAQSRRRRREAERRRAVLAEVEARDGWRCQAAVRGLPGSCGTIGGRQELEGHEPRGRGRQPGSHLDPEQVVLVCPRHHDAITGATGPLRELCEAAGLLLPAEPVDTLRIGDRI